MFVISTCMNISLLIERGDTIFDPVCKGKHSRGLGLSCPLCCFIMVVSVQCVLEIQANPFSCCFHLLQTRRRGSGVFAGKQGFMTLRDLFRWADRYKCKEVKLDKKFYDWDQHMADHGKKFIWYSVVTCRLRIIQILIEEYERNLFNIY